MFTAQIRQILPETTPKTSGPRLLYSKKDVLQYIETQFSGYDSAKYFASYMEELVKKKFLKLDYTELGVANFLELCKELPYICCVGKDSKPELRYTKNMEQGAKLFEKLRELAKELGREDVEAASYKKEDSDHSEWIISDLVSDINDLMQSKCEGLWSELESLAISKGMEIEKETYVTDGKWELDDLQEDLKALQSTD